MFWCVWTVSQTQPIGALAKRHPGVNFDLDLHDRRIDLVEEGMDIALRIGELRDSSYIARRLFDARSVVCAAPHYLKSHGEPQAPEDLSGHDCLVYTNLPDPDNWRYVDPDGNQKSIAVKSILSASSGDFLTNAASHGMGIVIQPTFIAAEAIRRGSLVPVLTDYDWPTTPAHAVYPPTRHLSYRVRAFIDFLAARFSGTPPWDKDCDAIISQPA